MSEESKDVKLSKLVDCGLITKEQIGDYKNLTKDQIDFLYSKFNANESVKKEKVETDPEAIIDAFLNNEKIDAFVKKTVSKEVVKRRKAEQELNTYKTNLKGLISKLSDFIK